MVIVSFIVFAFALLFKGYILCAACRLLKVRAPGIGHAMAIAFLASIAGGLSAILADDYLAIGKLSSPGAAQLWGFGIFLTVNMMVAPGVYSFRLEGVSYCKGIALYWVQAAIWLALALALKMGIYWYELARFGEFET